MSMKLTTVGAVVAAALILVPYGISDTGETRARPVVPAAQAVQPGAATVGKVIAAQGNAALVQIRSEVTQPTPPDLTRVTVESGPE